MSSNTLIESFDRNGRTIEIHKDVDAENPRREFDHTATFACWHRRYNLGDEQIRLCEEDAMRERVADIVALVPLYLYDHSGLTMSTSPFSCRYDSGQVGWAYVTEESLAKMGFEEVPPEERLDEIVKSEVEEYDRYLRGAVYGYVVKGIDGEHLDSCWGFYDDVEYVKAEAVRACDAAEDPADARMAEELRNRATFAGPESIAEIDE